jgi:hypothetical protein
VLCNTTPGELLPFEPFGRAELNGAAARRSQAAASSQQEGAGIPWLVKGSSFLDLGKGGVDSLFLRGFYHGFSSPVPR